MKYRPDIDGLRSVAVLSIFLFHIDPHWVPGGYVGVDIFFVISGFLIGGIVHGQLNAGNFSIVNFYERRFRRIIPALFAMLLVVTAFGYFFLFPAIYADFAKSSIASALSVSNIYFWQTTNYFGLDGHSKPLLHTWSLGVEEQFYIVFPLMLWALFRWWPKRLALVVVAVALASFLLSAVGAYTSPSGTFYLLPTRAWELLLGFMLVLMPTTFLNNAALRTTLSLAGAAAILFAFVYYDNDTPFPGMAALAPCLGSALIIASGGSGPTPVSRLLAMKPFVWVGLISYSLYLWHWPLIVLLREAVPVNYFTPVQGVGVLVAGLILGYLSWRFVEQPFRSGAISRRAIFTGTAGGAALISAICLAVITGGGLPGRFDPKVARMAEAIEYTGHTVYPHGTCFLDGYDFSKAGEDPCLKLDPARQNIAIVGDSHAEHLWYGLKQALPEINFIPATVSGCTPRLNPLPHDLERCTKPIDYVLRNYLPAQSVDLVLLAANWQADDLPRVKELTEWLDENNIPVVLVGPIAAYETQAAKLIALSYLKDDPGLPDRFMQARQVRLDARFVDFARQEGLPYMSAYRAICPDQCQRLAANGMPLQYDTAHLTDEGSLFMAERLAPMLRQQLKTSAPNGN
ncbi:MAG: acyltransferase family protein [Sphingomonadaceae bacterium]